MGTKKSGCIKVNDVTLFYKELGKGPPLLLLHGWGQSHVIYKGLSRRLARTFRVILIDSRGHGASGSGTLDLTIPRLADDAVGVLDYFELEKASILGFSDGGNVALQAATSHPSRLDKIVAISANATPDGLAGSFLWDTQWVRRFGGLVKKLGVDARRILEKEELLLLWPQISDEQLRAIKTPILLLAAEHDIVKREHTRHLHHTIPNSKLLIIENTYHFNIVEAWRRYVKKVEEFLQTQTSSAGGE